MSNISKSPDRGIFRSTSLMNRVEAGTTSIKHATEMMDLYKSWEQHKLDLEETDDWKKDNMEYDLRSTPWIVDKAKASKVYSQNMYAAMCNRDFIKNDVWPLLTDKRWGCSWRSAGGIIADMREEGDYIDWYCSGIRDTTELDDEQFMQFTKEQQDIFIETKRYVGESVVTDEIRQDLLKLGWIVLDDGLDN